MLSQELNIKKNALERKLKQFDEIVFLDCYWIYNIYL